jgi:hypothetical protein
VSACVGNRSGSVRLVTAHTRCRHGESAVTWNQVGPAGTAGKPGATGATGAPGAAGATGAPGSSVTSSTLSTGDTTCPAGGSRFSSASGVTFACSGAPATLSTTAGPTQIILPGVINFPPIVLQNLGHVQLTPQLEIHNGSGVAFTATCQTQVLTGVDGVTHTLPSQSISVPASDTSDYDLEVTVDGGGAGNAMTVDFSCTAPVASPGTTITPSVTAVT